MRKIPLLLAPFCLTAGLSAEETVVLTNGDKISGEVKSLAGGVFQVETAYGPLTIPKSKVARIDFGNAGPVSGILRGLAEGMEGREPRPETGRDVLETALDLVESYRGSDGSREAQKQVEELMDRFESVLGRFLERGGRSRTEKPKPPADAAKKEPGEGDKGGK